LILKDPYFELLNQPELFITNYRFIPPEISRRLDILMKNPSANREEITAINHMLNELNIELHKGIREKDTSFVSRTRLESTRYAPRKVVVLRAVTVNPNTEKYMLKKILAEHRDMGIKLWESMLKKGPMPGIRKAMSVN